MVFRQFFKPILIQIGLNLGLINYTRKKISECVLFMAYGITFGKNGQIWTYEIFLKICENGFFIKLLF